MATQVRLPGREETVPIATTTTSQFDQDADDFPQRPEDTKPIVTPTLTPTTSPFEDSPRVGSPGWGEMEPANNEMNGIDITHFAPLIAIVLFLGLCMWSINIGQSGSGKNRGHGSRNRRHVHHGTNDPLRPRGHDTGNWIGDGTTGGGFFGGGGGFGGGCDSGGGGGGGFGGGGGGCGGCGGGD